MPNMMKLPDDWKNMGTGRQLIDEGEYIVVVDDVTQRDNNRITAVLKVLDEGKFCAWTLYDNFPLIYEVGRRMFKEFLDVLDIDQSSGSIDLNLCKRRPLRVTIKHKTGKDGKTWANVTAHRRDTQ